jgi:hypothetical protein
MMMAHTHTGERESTVADYTGKALFFVAFKCPPEHEAEGDARDARHALRLGDRSRPSSPVVLHCRRRLAPRLLRAARQAWWRACSCCAEATRMAVVTSFAASNTA